MIAHFDDDDMYAPNYLSWMFSQLLACSTKKTQSDINPISTVNFPGCSNSPVGAHATAPSRCLAPALLKLSSWHMIDLRDLSFRYLDVKTDPSVPDSEREAWLHGWGFSFLYTRSAWELAPFPDISFPEDRCFFEGLVSRQIAVYFVDAPLEGCIAHSTHFDSTSGGEYTERGAPCGQMVAQPVIFRNLVVAAQRSHQLMRGGAW